MAWGFPLFSFRTSDGDGIKSILITHLPDIAENDFVVILDVICQCIDSNVRRREKHGSNWS